MKKIDLGQTINTLANLGVIAGILFLAIEVGQNNALLGAQARTDRVAIRLDAGDQLATNLHLIDAIVKDRAGGPLSPSEELLLEEWYLATLVRFQYVFVENQEGLIEDSYLPVDGWAAVMYKEPKMLDVWNRMGERELRPDFVKFMNEQVLTRPHQ